jgi:ABC-type molybdenum transport system ATPase subunit/photorepair protein PhrA
MIQEPDGTELDTFHRLNTGELNLLALVLFLLFARRVNNPLRLLVLDDPLQNFDELTVSAVACGLQKMVFKFSSEVEDWQFLILLHSEADLNRISSLVPGTVYLPPWLSPADREREDPF